MDGKFEITFTTPSRLIDLDDILAEISNEFGKWMIKGDKFLYYKPKYEVNERQLRMIKIWKRNAPSFFAYKIGFAVKVYRCGYFMLNATYQDWEPLTHYIILIDASALFDDEKFAASCPPEDNFITKNLANDNGTTDYLEELLESGKLADITINTAGDKEIKAHNLMLSRSKFFNAMLNINDTVEAREKIININDVDYALVKEFLRFIYCGKVPKLEEMAQDLMALAVRYEIKELVQVCGSHLIEKEDIENIADVLIPANNMQLHDLKDAAIELVIQNIKQVRKTKGWNQLKISHCSLALQIVEKYFDEYE